MQASHSWWRGIVIPASTGNQRDIAAWIVWFGFSGSVCFLVGGISGYVYDDLTFHEFQVVNCFTWILGACFFVAKGSLLWLEQMNPHW